MGAPNVGKSSLVQLLSSGLPEVQNYPFTTRSIKMGHFYVAGRRHQVTGAPQRWAGLGGVGQGRVGKDALQLAAPADACSKVAAGMLPLACCWRR